MPRTSGAPGEYVSVEMIAGSGLRTSQFPESIWSDAGGGRVRPAPPVHSFPFLGLGFPEMGKVHKNFKYSMLDFSTEKKIHKNREWRDFFIHVYISINYTILFFLHPVQCLYEWWRPRQGALHPPPPHRSLTR